MSKKCAFLGRFQPFHLGHKHVVEQFNGEELVLVIGSAGKSRTDENPLKAKERTELIHECHPEIQIYKVEDQESDKEWMEDVIGKTGAGEIISGNKRVRDIFTEMSDLEVKEPEMHRPEIYSGTEVRRRINSGGEWSYLVPECAREKLRELEEKIKESGTQYEFKPGWKKENAYHGTSE